MKRVPLIGHVGTRCACVNQGAPALHALCQSKPSFDVVKYLLHTTHPKSVSEKTRAGALPVILACVVVSVRGRASGFAGGASDGFGQDENALQSVELQ